ncbi:MAG: hypothetical protein IKM21_04625 [Oscillospiraceae bacterium]|nr:hypothetical protein [Oscillospiraceae bacterium]
MKKSFVYMLILTVFVLSACACTEKKDYANERNNMPEPQQVSSMGELVNYTGEYIIGDLVSLPRVGLMTDEYAKKETNIPGKKLSITKEGIEFDGEFFECTKIMQCDSELISDYYNVGGVSATNLCEVGEMVTDYTFLNKDNKCISLILNMDGELKMWVTEPYVYIGGYEVVHVQQ